MRRVELENQVSIVSRRRPQLIAIIGIHERDSRRLVAEKKGPPIESIWSIDHVHWIDKEVFYGSG